MSLENGNNMFNYCGGLFEKYKKDRMVFVKALQIIQFYQARSDFPYCDKELDEVMIKILGYDLEWLARYPYTYGVFMEEVITWDAENTIDFEAIEIESEKQHKSLVEDIPIEKQKEVVFQFVEEFKAFLITIGPLLNEIFVGENNSFKLAKVAKKSTYGKECDLRFIRKDDTFLDITMTNDEIDRLCETLQGFKTV